MADMKWCPSSGYENDVLFGSQDFSKSNLELRGYKMTSEQWEALRDYFFKTDFDKLFSLKFQEELNRTLTKKMADLGVNKDDDSSSAYSEDNTDKDNDE